MVFLGVDQSLNATGLCLVTRDGRELQSSTVDPGAFTGGERLVMIKNALVTACVAVDWEIEGAALEGYSMGSVNRPFDLGEVGGIIRLVLAENHVPYVVAAPVLVKMFATGNTGASKEAMIKAAKAAGASPDNDNEADAFFLARVARAYHSKVDMLRQEMDAIRALKEPPSRTTRRRPRKLIANAI